MLRGIISLCLNIFTKFAFYLKVTPHRSFVNGLHLLWGRAKRRENRRLRSAHRCCVEAECQSFADDRDRGLRTRTHNNGRKTREGGREGRKLEYSRGEKRGKRFFTKSIGGRGRRQRSRHGAGRWPWPLSFAQFPKFSNSQSPLDMNRKKQTSGLKSLPKYSLRAMLQHC